jgi:hypothetical protein
MSLLQVGLQTNHGEGNNDYTEACGHITRKEKSRNSFNVFDYVKLIQIKFKIIMSSVSYVWP